MDSTELGENWTNCEQDESKRGEQDDTPTVLSPVEGPLDLPPPGNHRGCSDLKAHENC